MLCEENGVVGWEGVLAGQLRRAVFGELEARLNAVARVLEGVGGDRGGVHVAGVKRIAYQTCHVGFPKVCPESEAAPQDWQLRWILQKHRWNMDPAVVREILRDNEITPE
jgi:hypothetical protein